MIKNNLRHSVFTFLSLICTLTNGYGKEESTLAIATPTKHELNPDCRLQRESGPCRASFRRFYYDINTNDCALFVYGGCLGNGNNFGSFAECRQKCKKEQMNAKSFQVENLISVEQDKITKAPQITINYRHFKRPYDSGDICWRTNQSNNLSGGIEGRHMVDKGGIKICRWELPNMQDYKSFASSLWYYNDSVRHVMAQLIANKRYKRAYPYRQSNNQPPQIKPLQDYIMQMSILSIGNEVIYMNDSYSNTSSPEYQELARLTSLGVEIVSRTSDLRMFYIRTKVSDAYDAGILNPALSKRILLFSLILLSPDYDRGPAFIKRIFKGTIFTSGCFLGGTRLCVDPMSLKVFPAALFNPNLLTTLTSITTSQPDGITLVAGSNETFTLYIMGGGTIDVNSSNITTTTPLTPETNSSGANITYIVKCDEESRASKQAPPVCGDNSACISVSLSNSTQNSTGNESWCVCNLGYNRWGDSIHCKNASTPFICQPFEFVCQGVEPSCIMWNKFQDGKDDCPDGSDERCSPWQFDCKISDGSSKRCIANDKVNDNVKDCLDGSDENK